MEADSSELQAPVDLLFFGTPSFAVPTLEVLCNLPQVRVKAVVTQTDKPAHRGHTLTPPPVKAAASQRGIPVYQPKTLRNLIAPSSSPSTPDSESQRLADLFHTTPPQLIVVVAYGKLLPADLLALPAFGALNVHASLLPRWRGAAPLQHALLEGDRETGVCIMRMEEGLDTGPVYARSEVEIAPDETYGTLHDKLATAGAELLAKVLPKIISGTLTPGPQPAEGVTYARKWERSDCEIDWTETADRIARRVRACHPQPGARTTFAEDSVKLLRAHVVEQSAPSTAPGRVIWRSRTELHVSAGGGTVLAIDEMQFPGRRSLPIEEILKGRPIEAGDQFGPNR